MARDDERVPARRGESRPPAYRSDPMMSPFFDLRRQIDQLFEDVSRSFGMPAFGRGMMPGPFGPGFGPGLGEGGGAPRVDVHETDKEVVITADLPGVDEKDVELTVADGVLTLRGEKRADSRQERADYHLMERSYGSFTRSFRLPEAIDEERIGAAFDKGVLTIRLPKSEQAQQQARRIAINAGQETGGAAPAEGDRPKGGRGRR